jgi:hypothetical protein
MLGAERGGERELEEQRVKLMQETSALVNGLEEVRELGGSELVG